MNDLNLDAVTARINGAVAEAAVAEVRALRAKVERVEALALGWQERSLPGMTEWDFGQDVRDALRGDS